jgi:hypothetical protein
MLQTLKRGAHLTTSAAGTAAITGSAADKNPSGFFPDLTQHMPHVNVKEKKLAQTCVAL